MTKARTATIISAVSVVAAGGLAWQFALSPRMAEAQSINTQAMDVERQNVMLINRYNEAVSRALDAPKVAAEAQALQFMTDMNELHSELMAAANAGQATGDVAALQAHLTGARYKSHLAAIDRMLQGDYFFGGEAPSVSYGHVALLLDDVEHAREARRRPETRRTR